MNNNLLLEIGIEELPTGYIKFILKNLSMKLSAGLVKNNIEHCSLRTFATPRRLTVFVDEISMKQKDSLKIVYGPPANIAFDEKNNYTKAAVKFAEKLNIPLEKLEVFSNKKGCYLVAKKELVGESTKSILERFLPKMILSLTFPKNMRWSNFSITFGRPIRTIVALLGSEIIKFHLEKVIKSGRKTTGHLIMNPCLIDIPNPDVYISYMKKVNVIVDFKERRKLILMEANRVANSVNGKLLFNEKLLDIVSNLVELPVVFMGEFDSSFLNIPREIIITVLQETQKYFAIINTNRDLLPNFVGVSNTFSSNMNLVKSGHERVLRARLTDARFFYNIDIKDSMDLWAEKLKGMFLISKLGSVYDKVIRIKLIVSYLAKITNLKINEDIIRACLLCKGDLVSRVVTEFPNLQGIMGSIYAQLAGESKLVYEAIREHYLPKKSDGELPKTHIGKLLAIADKIDSICGCFSAGLSSTGTSDPYALRRQSFGLLRIILDANLDLSIKSLVHKVLLNFKMKMNYKEFIRVEKDIFNFLRNRFFSLMIERGYSSDLVNGVVDIHWGSILKINKLVVALTEFKKREEFSFIITVFKRIDRILFKLGFKSNDDINVTAKLFEDESEFVLNRVCKDINLKIMTCLDAGDVLGALESLALFNNPVNSFFDRVLVIVEDVEIRRNRACLLRNVWNVFRSIANFKNISL